jgi:hypothetical protein
MEIQSLLQALSLIPSLAILVGVIIILVRTRSVAGILLVISQSVSVLMHIFWSLIYPFVNSRSGFALSGSENQMITFGAQALGFLDATIFAVGIFLLAYQNLGKKE